MIDVVIAFENGVTYLYKRVPDSCFQVRGSYLECSCGEIVHGQELEPGSTITIKVPKEKNG